MPDNHIHIVSFDIPYPANYGGVIDVFYKLKSLSERGVKIHLHTFEYGREHSSALEKLCFSVNYYKRDTSFKKSLQRLPYIVTSRLSDELIENLKKDDYPVLLEGLHCCGVLLDKTMTGRKVFVRTHNVEHDYYRLLAKSEKNLYKRVFFVAESARLRRFEPILNRATGILAISNNDFEYFSHRYKNVSLIPAYNGFDEVNVIDGQGDYVLYHGKLDVAENYNAAEFLVKKVFNDIDVNLKIAGMNPPEHLVALAAENRNVELIPNPDDELMQNLIRNAHINILVTAQATGLKLKLLNALFNGRYCVVNSKMVDGLNVNDLCVVADSADEMKTVILNLMDKSFSEELVSVRKSRMGDFYDASRATDRLLSVLFG
ncbi:MAG: glycosyltransferase [Bacteroidales bacterium]|nr:glycosyltransferase [Bacteroidales bacterium]